MARAPAQRGRAGGLRTRTARARGPGPGRGLAWGGEGRGVPEAASQNGWRMVTRGRHLERAVPRKSVSVPRKSSSDSRPEVWNLGAFTSAVVRK